MLVGAGEVVEGVGGDVGSGVAVDGVDPDGVVSDEDFDGVVGLSVVVGDFCGVEVCVDVDCFLGGLWLHGFSVVVVFGFLVCFLGCSFMGVWWWFWGVGIFLVSVYRCLVVVWFFVVCFFVFCCGGCGWVVVVGVFL